MRCREFIAGSLATLPGALSAGAAPAGAWRVGQVFGGSPNIVTSSGPVQGLAELGYVDGKNIHLQMRFTVPTPGDMKAVILALLPEIDLRGCRRMATLIHRRFRGDLVWCL